MLYCDIENSGVIDVACVENTDNICIDGQRYYRQYSYTVDNPERIRTGVTGCLGEAEVSESDAEATMDNIVLTQAQFRSLPLASAGIQFQDEVEGWGVALVGHHVNVWADSEAQTLTTTILGTEVEVRATPIEYRWSYGDGRTRTVAEPGGPRPEDADPYEFSTVTSVVYEETGNYDIGLETVYTGQFRYNGSPWLPVSGVAVVPSDPRGVSIWETVTRNVAEDCIENPDGWACRSPWLTTPPWEE
ncbi:hypothetical protein [Zhihengliuella sp.]|uniref:hypothetical protein n=1 Tax=Zhihengliuella sp. TaxID=1954483 RepID=UPI002811412D|nr:hypothetical protein [Zhihengliuella sp.]